MPGSAGAGEDARGSGVAAGAGEHGDPGGVKAAAVRSEARSGGRGCRGEGLLGGQGGRRGGAGCGQLGGAAGRQREQVSAAELDGQGVGDAGERGVERAEGGPCLPASRVWISGE